MIMPLVSAMAVSNVGVNRIADSVIQRGFGVSFPIQNPDICEGQSCQDW